MTQSGPPPGWCTIDELAAAAGTTSRNVRAFQSRGLLPPPRLVGRTGRYDDGHPARLEAILRLPRRGYSLAAIAALSATWAAGGTLEAVLGFEEPAPRRPPSTSTAGSGAAGLSPDPPR